MSLVFGLFNDWCQPTRAHRRSTGRCVPRRAHQPTYDAPNPGAVWLAREAVVHPPEAPSRTP